MPLMPQNQCPCNNLTKCAAAFQIRIGNPLESREKGWEIEIRTSRYVTSTRVWQSPARVFARELSAFAPCAARDAQPAPSNRSDEMRRNPGHCRHRNIRGIAADDANWLRSSVRRR